MRADAAAIGGIADHQVVQPRVGNEAELAQQRVGRIIVQIDALDQQRPVRLRWQPAGLLTGPLPFPLPPTACNQARFDVILVRPVRKQCIARQQRLEAGNRLADQQEVSCASSRAGIAAGVMSPRRVIFFMATLYRNANCSQRAGTADDSARAGGRV